MNASVENQDNTAQPRSGGGMDTSAVGAENLTSQIAGMSKHQLYQIVSQMKDLIQQNQQQARQILIANPQLTKTLFQAQIMLGMVRAPDTLPPAAMAASQVPASVAPAQPSQQSAVQIPALQVPPTPTPQSVGTFQSLSSPQPAASQQTPPQMASPYLQPSQVPSTPLQASQPSFQFQQSLQTPSALPAAALQQPPMQHAASQPPLPSHPPPLPQQPRPLAPPSQAQQQVTQGIGFAPPSIPQSYHPQASYMQQAGGPVQTNVSPSFQQMHVPPLPSQPPPQHMFQVESGRGLSMGVPSTSAPWNQALSSTGAVGVPQVTPAGHMVPGQHPFVGGVGLSSSMAPGAGSSTSQLFSQPLAQPLPPQQPQHQPQMPIELEQQKALLQQVMNLTPDQINSLPPEQRQQVLQLQQAFRSQTG